MNLWGLQPGFFKHLEAGFLEFLQDISTGDSSEYLLPEVVGGLVRRGETTVQVLPTDGHWFGVTYKEDKPLVVSSIRALVDAGEYPEKLYG